MPKRNGYYAEMETTYPEYEREYDGAAKRQRLNPSEVAPDQVLAEFIDRCPDDPALNEYSLLLETCTQRNAPLTINMRQKSQLMDGLRARLQSIFENPEGYQYGGWILRLVRALSPQINQNDDSGRPFVIVKGPMNVDDTGGQTVIEFRQPQNYTVRTERRVGNAQGAVFKVNFTGAETTVDRVEMW
jgi:hypothetical protein